MNLETIFGPVEATLQLVCTSQKHPEREERLLTFVRTPEGWTSIAQNRLMHRRGDRDIKADGGTLADVYASPRLKHGFKCQHCRDELQVGAGQWPRLERALDALAPHMGDTVPLRLLRASYDIV